MQERVDKFLNQLSVTEQTFRPEVEYYDSDVNNTELHVYNKEVIIELPDFDMEFTLKIEETGTVVENLDECGRVCMASDFTVDNRDVEIQEFRVYDTENGTDLVLPREILEDIFTKVYDLIIF